MASSPSEFLTFYRRLASSSTLRNGAVCRTTIRPFSSTYRVGNNIQNDIGKPDAKRTHTTEKRYEPNVQVDASHKGQKERANNQGGSATTERDQTNATKKAKEEFPEAPTTIGFQDERGGKGH